MAVSNIETVQLVYRAMQNGDHVGMFSLLAPTVKIWQSEELPWGGQYEGLDGAKVFFSKVTTYLNPSVALERLLDSGDFVVAIGQTQGTTRANGTPFNVPLIHLWQLGDGKITGLQVFLENETMKRALR